MKPLLQPVRTILNDLSLRSTVAIALVVGLSLPALVSAWRDIEDRRATLLANLTQDHQRLLEILAIGMQVPIWDVRPETGQPLIDTLMRDERVTSVTVSAGPFPEFLSAAANDRLEGQIQSKQSPVVRNGEPIGIVRLAMSTARLETEISKQWRQVLTTGVLQLALGLLIIFPLLRFKVLAPVDRLVRQSRGLAAGDLDQSLAWRHNDELGLLGQSFEETRRALRDLFTDLDQRNRDLQKRELELADKSSVLRATLDNMTDGITLIDEGLHLVAWNDRVSEILGIPKDKLCAGVHIEDVVTRNLETRGFATDEARAVLREVLRTFKPSSPSASHFRTHDGREIDVRRQPIPGGGFVSTYTDVTEQVEARRKVADTLSLLEAVMDATPAIISVKDRNRRYQIVNRYLLECLGLTQDQVIGKTRKEVFGPDYSPETDRQDRRVIETRQRLPFFERVHRGQGGQILTTWTTKVPLLGEDGEVGHILTVDIDISERKRAEEERQRWLQLFRDAIESIPYGFAVFDTDERLVTCNGAYAKLYDMPSKDLVGVQVSDLLDPVLARMRSVDGVPVTHETMDSIGALFRDLWTGRGPPFEAELHDGRWAFISRHPTEEGGFVLIRADVTESKRLEEALRESEERFRSIAEAHPVAVDIVHLGDGTVLYASPATAELWGKAREDIVGCDVALFYADPLELERARATFSRTRSLNSYETVHRRADGTHVPVALTSRPIRYDGRNAVITAIVDLTEQKEAERQIAQQREALYQSEKLNALGALLAGVAHELNNPLSVVVGQALLLKETVTDPAIKKRAERIGTAADRCARIVKTFLAMVRQSTPERTQVDVNEIVEAALEITAYSLRSADVEIERRLAPDLPAVWADPDQMSQVLMNLIVNAQQAMAEKIGQRKLEIATDADPSSESVRVMVHDNGPGMSPEVGARIFDPFFTTKEIGRGTGIGLSVCRGMVEAHGGRIEAWSEPGKGATFTVSLPRSVRQAAAKKTPRRSAESRLRCAVLIVDDEADVSEMLAETLLSDGHEVETANSGNSALRLLANRKFDVILSDVRMPDVDGQGLYTRIRSAYPDLVNRIVFITGDALGPSISLFLERTGLRYLEKPVDPDEVREIVQQVAAEAAGGSEGAQPLRGPD